MSEDRLYWNMDVEPFLNTPAMKTLQLEKLKVMLKRIYENAPFHRKRLDEAGLTSDNIDAKIKSLDDYSRMVPVYDKEGFRKHAEDCGGDLVKLMDEEAPISVDDLILVNSTTGTVE